MRWAMRWSALARRRGVGSAALLGVVLLALGLAACGEAPPPSAATLLHNAQAKFNQTKTFHFTLTATNLGPNDQLGVTSAAGDVQRPDELSATATVLVSGFSIDAKLVIVGQQEWLTTSVTGTQKTNQFASFLTIFDPQQGIGGILLRMQQPTTPQSTTVGGITCWKISGRVATSDLAAIISGNVLAGQTVPATACIGKSDSEVYSVVLTGPISQTDTAQTTRTFTLSKFDQPVTIQPPAA